MTEPVFGPVLILGGYGSVGSRTARALRRLHPELPLVIAGRDSAKAHALGETDRTTGKIVLTVR